MPWALAWWIPTEAPAGTASSLDNSHSQQLTARVVSTENSLPFQLFSFTRVLSVGNSHKQKCSAINWELGFLRNTAFNFSQIQQPGEWYEFGCNFPTCKAVGQSRETLVVLPLQDSRVCSTFSKHQRIYQAEKSNKQRAQQEGNILFTPWVHHVRKLHKKPFTFHA